MIRKLYFLDLFKLSLSRGWVSHLRIFITAGLFALTILEAIYMLTMAGIECIRDEAEVWYDRRKVNVAERKRMETIERLNDR